MQAMTRNFAQLPGPAKKEPFFGVVYLIFLKVVPYEHQPVLQIFQVKQQNVSFHGFSTGHASPLRHGRPR